MSAQVIANRENFDHTILDTVQKDDYVNRESQHEIVEARETRSLSLYAKILLLSALIEG